MLIQVNMRRAAAKLDKSREAFRLWQERCAGPGRKIMAFCLEERSREPTGVPSMSEAIRFKTKTTGARSCRRAELFRHPQAATERRNKQRFLDRPRGFAVSRFEKPFVIRELDPAGLGDFTQRNLHFLKRRVDRK